MLGFGRAEDIWVERIFEVNFMADNSSHSSETAACAGEPGTIAWHPTKTLLEDSIHAILPGVFAFAAAKNVTLAAGDEISLARYALWPVSRRTMRAMLKVDPVAVLKVQCRIAHALDVFVMACFTWEIFKAEGRELPGLPTLYSIAEKLLEAEHANDKAPMRKVWPSVASMVEDHFALAASAESQSATMTLPHNAIRRSAITIPLLPAIKRQAVRSRHAGCDVGEARDG